MTFEQQSEAFIQSIQTRKRNPVKPATVEKYEACLKHALPLLGNRDLSQVNNSSLKVLVAKLSEEGLSASTITCVAVVVKLVVASAVNDEGEELYPRSWNNEFAELPIINVSAQKAPVANSGAITAAIAKSRGIDKALYALLAGTGLRIGEALVLTSADWDKAAMTVSVTKTLVGNAVQNSTKTEAGIRTVDLTPELNNFLIQTIGGVDGRLFPMNKVTAWRHMESDGLYDGAHTLRRFRVTQLRKSAVPEGLIKYWTGHSNESITDRYDKIRDDVVARKQFAIKAGLGFQLEAA